MLNSLTPIVGSSPSPTVRAEPRPSMGSERHLPARATVVAERPAAAEKAPAGTAGRTFERIVQQAARELFPGREIAVESFFDKDSGRYVHRIADGQSGELLIQTPPDELLRFFASSREMLDKPLLELDA